MTEYSLGNLYLSPTGPVNSLVTGPNGNLWFLGVHKIYQAMILEPDSTKPLSRVSAIPASTSAPVFTVRWSGSDTISGVRDYTIYVSDNGYPFAVWLKRTKASEDTFNGLAGHSYGFYSIARDWAGNMEDSKVAPEATTQMASRFTSDVNGDGRVDCGDIFVVKASYGRRTGMPGFDPRADIDGDGVVDVRDLARVSQSLPSGIFCS
jgi:hypothetical protein